MGASQSQPLYFFQPHAHQARRNPRRHPRPCSRCQSGQRRRRSYFRGAASLASRISRKLAPRLEIRSGHHRRTQKGVTLEGLIRADFDLPKLAAELEFAGAACLSVLTDEQFFQGSLHNLELASAATRIPCLRKDFIIDDFQLPEARACRADAILLIVAALTQDDLTTLYRRARELQLDVLVEVHDAAELDRALAAGCDLIGVNNRNLHTFEVTLQTSLDLAPRIPASVVKVAESGINSAADIARLRDAGFNAFLIGESLMRAPSPGEALRALLAS